MADSKVNNFPLEGLHHVVTRDHVEQLERNPAKPGVTLTYTLGGYGETVVHSTVEAAKRYGATKGRQILNKVSDKFQRDQVFSANEGRARAEFGKQSKVEKRAAYIKQQKSLMKQSFDQNIDRAQLQSNVLNETLRNYQHSRTRNR